MSAMRHKSNGHVLVESIPQQYGWYTRDSAEGPPDYLHVDYETFAILWRIPNHTWRSMLITVARSFTPKQTALLYMTVGHPVDPNVRATRDEMDYFREIAHRYDVPDVISGYPANHSCCAIWNAVHNRFRSYNRGDVDDYQFICLGLGAPLKIICHLHTFAGRKVSTRR